MVVGVAVGLATALVMRKYATSLIEKLSTGALRPVLTDEVARIRSEADPAR
ncbi:hypothetical protein ACIBG0_39445 [Nocardia sp. NPDC050630]|uniref:hypothetical protein n=1 Tax=Nocardia sp. NPDC050630 TaxID=3364321 RepID=UPI0037A2A49B